METLAILLFLFGSLGAIVLVIIGTIFAILKKQGVKKYFLLAAVCFCLVIVSFFVIPTSQETIKSANTNSNNIVSNDVAKKEDETKATKKSSNETAQKLTTGSIQTPNTPQNKLKATDSSTSSNSDASSYDIKISFPVSKYPETAEHIKEAIKAGESAVCTIDRKGADENRKESLDGVETKDGYDRDEWPMAMCAEGGSGADIEYITPADNRGAGSWVGNALEDYPDGTRVLFTFAETAVAKESNDTATKVKSSTGSSSKSSSKDKSSSTNKSSNSKKSSSNQSTSSAKTESPSTESEQSSTVYYKNCTAAREAGAAPLYEGDPGYRAKLDRDKDGVACE